MLVSPELVASTKVPLCANSQQQAEKARRLMHEGLEQALAAHTALLFRTWLAGHAESRANAAAGIRNEVRGFFYAEGVIDDWSIPLCRDAKKSQSQ